MKKKLLSLLLVPVLLTGCGADWKDQTFVHEQRILASLEEQSDGVWLYPNTMKALASAVRRQTVIKGNSNGRIVQSETLCDVYPYVQLDEARWPLGKYKLDMNAVYKIMYGITYDQACGRTPRFTTKDPEIEVINTAKNSGVLSNAQVKEITEAVKTCERAKVKVINIKDSGKKLTVGDYEKIMDITSDCNDFLLEKALNE